MSEKSVVRIHTKQLPPKTDAVRSTKSVFRRFGKHPRAGLSAADRSRAVSPRHTIVRASAGPTERLLRNSAIACALLLGVLTLAGVDQPWAQKASKGIEQALTMRIDLDDTIGELTFVKELMPESALVFLNINGRSRLELPVEGSCDHPWSEAQPWLMFACPSGGAVHAVEAGTVTAVSPLSDGLTGILIDHGGGSESLYALIETSDVKNGDAVARGQQIGKASEQLYFEWRENGASVDPTEALGL